jgi:phage shock protein A
MYHHDPLLQVERQTKYIQRNLQTLIDAQSEGLLAGLARSQPEDTSEEGSFTPTSSAAGRARSPSTTPARQPSVKNIGLRAARQGIFLSIYDLLKLREEERDILLSQTDERDNALREIQGFTSRKAGLEEAISSIHNDRENQQAKQLQEEARSLETDIRELETKLYEMKAKHRNLISKISNIENSVDSKLSSYTESLSLLQSDIQSYLRDPPVQPLSRRSSESSFYSLNPKRRTLDMAEEHWKLERERLHKRQHEVDAEILALEEGGGVWKQAIAGVSGFEKRLRANMRHYMEVQSSATDSNNAQASETMEEVATNVSEDLDKTIQRLETHLELAEKKDWKLLVCCIAAELEALREARGMLLPAFGLPVHDDAPPSQSPSSSSSEGQVLEEASDGHEHSSDNDDSEPPADLLKDEQAHYTDTASRSEDDEPDPAWL